MARKTFFSFHYERDAWRAAIVRNSNAIADEDEYGVIDAVDWETIERQGDDAVRRWIQDQLRFTSVTAVLVGAETASRRWVKYEIIESWNRGNGLVAIRINSIKNSAGDIDAPGANPFASVFLEDGTPLSAYTKIYDWTVNDGRANMGAWLEEAAQLRGKAPNGVVAKRLVEPTAAVISNPPAQWNESDRF